MRVLFFHRNAEWLGIEYLSSALKKAGHDTELIFDPGSGDIEFKVSFLEKFFDVNDQMFRLAKNYKPDLIAFSCLTNLYPWVTFIASRLKSMMDVPIIVGGIHPTMLPEYVISNPDIDMICVGEGEAPIVELVDSMARGEIDYSIKNLWFKKDKEIIRNQIRGLNHDLDSLPFPDKELFYKYGCFKERLYIMTSRGCPCNCTYCFNHSLKKIYGDYKNYVRRRSVDNVIKELEHFNKIYSYKEVFFYDDIFTLDRNWVLKFCDEYKEKINKPFKCLIRPGTVDLILLQKLKMAGCRYVDIGLESGSEFVRKKILKRSMSNEQIIDTCRLLKQVKIQFTTLNMVGIPGETDKQMFETLELNMKIQPTSALFSTFYPFPNTVLAKKALEGGYISSSKYELIKQGGGSYKEDSVLTHPFEDTIKWIVTFSPILVKLPILNNILKRVSPNRFYRFVNIFFSSPLNNIRIRVEELFRSYIKSRITLKNMK